MKKLRFSKVALLLLALGILAQGAAAFALLTGERLLQYAICAPDVVTLDNSGGGTPRKETGIKDKIKARSNVGEQLADGLSALSLSGERAGLQISCGEKNATATLWCVDECFLETCPRPVVSGRWMDGSEIAYGNYVVVLDEDLAFQLFASDGAIGQKVWIGDREYRVVGTARHSRSVGETDEYSAYIPLNAADRQGLQLDTLTLNALPAAKTSMEQSFKSEAESAFGPGSLHNLKKDAMGALMLSRLILFALGMVLIARLVKILRAWSRKCFHHIRALHARSYARQYLLPAIWRILTIVVSALLIMGAAYALLSFMIEPVYTFTEWIPESLVDIAALKTVFWDRVTEAARLITVSTPQAARFAFYAGLARLGAVCFLLGLALGRRHEKKMKKSSEEGNQSGLNPV